VPSHPTLNRLRTPAVLLAVWLLFGSAFIAAKVGVSHVPPFLFGGARLLTAGVVLLAWAAWRDGPRLGLRWEDVAAAALVGLGLMVGGQGAAIWAVQYVPPGILAVLVTTVPIWVAVISWLVLRRPVPLPAVAGMAIAFAGVVFLASPAGGAAVGPSLLVLAGSLSWAAAAVYASRTAISRRPVLATGIQLTVGGAVQVVIGVALGEVGRLQGAELAGPAALAWVYLVLGPSLLGFPLFTWLLANTAPAVANTQSYASPVVTLALGWLLLGSPVSPAALAAATATLAGVALIVTTGSRRRPEPVRPAPDPDPDPPAEHQVA
jgi:drug/metabolite transporter (DMT)-like permease